MKSREFKLMLVLAVIFPFKFCEMVMRSNIRESIKQSTVHNDLPLHGRQLMIYQTLTM